MAEEPRKNPGDRLGDRYTIINWIGKGGQGEVYRALDTHLQQDVAIKVLGGELSRSLGDSARLEQEGKLLASFNHPMIVRVVDLFNHEGSVHLVSEYIPGRTLPIPRDGLPLNEFCRQAADIADAVAYAHSKNVVHRDLKPNNIILTDSLNIKILDFGLAKILSDTSPTGGVARTQITVPGTVVLGTKPYCAPEQARPGAEVGTPADVFSLGVLFYEMLAGQKPPSGSGEPLKEAIRKAESTSPTSFSSRNVPRLFMSLILSCLVSSFARREPVDFAG